MEDRKFLHVTITYFHYVSIEKFNLNLLFYACFVLWAKYIVVTTVMGKVICSNLKESHKIMQNQNTLISAIA